MTNRLLPHYVTKGCLTDVMGTPAQLELLMCICVVIITALRLMDSLSPRRRLLIETWLLMCSVMLFVLKCCAVLRAKKFAILLAFVAYIATYLPNIGMPS